MCQAFASWLRLLDRRRRVACVPISPETLLAVDPSLNLEACLRELHVLTPSGRLYVGWDGMALLARRFPATWIVGAIGAVPPFRWLGHAGYRFIARNRYAVSKCRGGACRAARLERVRRKAFFGSFWSCYLLGMFVRIPLIVAAFARDLARELSVYLRTWRRRIDFPGGKLSIAFLGGVPCDAVPILFGELFTMVLYDGLAIDPGSPRMLRSLARHLSRLPRGSLHAVVATHHHEEHVGNLNWVAERARVPIHVPEETARRLQSPWRLPWVRAAIIGQPPKLEPPFEILGDRIATRSGELEVFAAPGHSDDHVVLYDRRDKLLLAGDAFMGSYFATPNPDVDSRKWIETLERLLTLDIEVLVEGHGHVHTMRPDFPDIAGVVIREHPKDALREKLEYLRWLRAQIEAGIREGLPPATVEATCFPWGRGRAWETFSKSELIRLLSIGHFSRSELVRSFVRDENLGRVFPTVYQARIRTRTSPESPPQP